MTYIDATLAVLKRSRRSMTTGEITEAALRTGLIGPRGKTPERRWGPRFTSTSATQSRLTSAANSSRDEPAPPVVPSADTTFADGAGTPAYSNATASSLNSPGWSFANSACGTFT
jgi:HB1, ASXL, restriction endonuclease HTH domain